MVASQSPYTRRILDTTVSPDFNIIIVSMYVFHIYFVCFRHKSYVISFQAQLHLRKDGANGEKEHVEEDEEEKHGAKIEREM